MYYLIVFKHFVSIFSLIFDTIDPLFHSSYNILIPHFYTTLHPIWSNYESFAGPSYQHFGEVGCSPPPRTFTTLSISEFIMNSVQKDIYFYIFMQAHFVTPSVSPTVSSFNYCWSQPILMHIGTTALHSCLDL